MVWDEFDLSELLEDTDQAPEGLELYDLHLGFVDAWGRPHPQKFAVYPEQSVARPEEDPSSSINLRTAVVHPDFRERHGGRAFRWGFNEEVRAVVVWPDRWAGSGELDQL